MNTDNSSSTGNTNNNNDDIEFLNTAMDDDAFIETLLDDTVDYFNLNAVHMECQENAKVSTNYFTVDRKEPKPPDGDNADSPILSGVQMMESFLNVGNRKSTALAFSSPPLPASAPPIAGTFASQQAASASAAASTNLKHVSSSSTGTATETAALSSEATTMADSTAIAIAAAAAAAANSFAVGPTAQMMRSFPLPIPFVIPPPAGVDGASSGENKNTGANSSGPGVNTQPLPAKLQLDASRDRLVQSNQFGFGRNHVVPSTPKPPLAARMSSLPNSRLTNAVRGNYSSNGKSFSSLSSNKSESASPIPMNEAYERKKQRAKVGRAKMNDAIDHMAIAMNVAGSQSLKRYAAISAFKGFEKGEISDVYAAVLDSLTGCNKIDEDAKKWERPSFIGSAAEMIDALNLQCEALTKLYEHTCQSQSASSQGSAARAKNSRDEGEKENEASPKKRHKPNDDAEANIQENNMHDESIDVFRKIVSHNPILMTLASFLDPSSLARSFCVSKYWNALDAFRSDDTWRFICIRRFGQENADIWESSRRWIEIHKEMATLNVPPFCINHANEAIGKGNTKGVSAWASVERRSNGETSRSVKVKGKEDGYDRYTSLPIVELRILIQNTASANRVVVVPEQTLSIDTSTRRRGDEMIEVQSDDRFKKSVTNINGSPIIDGCKSSDKGELFRLPLFDSVVLTAYVHAKGCSTIDKFYKKANYTKVLVNINGKTMPIVIPFDGIVADSDKTSETVSS